MSISVEQEVNGLISLLRIQFSLQLANYGSYEKAYQQAKKDLTDKLGLDDWQTENFLNLVVVPQVSVEKGVSVGTSIQRLEYYLERHRGKLRPQMLALKCVVGEWVDVKASTAFQSENEMNHQRYAVITMATDTMTDEPSLCLQLHDGEFIYVNDYIGLRKVCTAFDHIAMK